MIAHPRHINLVQVTLERFGVELDVNDAPTSPWTAALRFALRIRASLRVLADAAACALTPAVLPSSEAVCFLEAQTSTKVLAAEFKCSRDTLLGGADPGTCPTTCQAFFNLVR